MSTPSWGWDRFAALLTKLTGRPVLNVKAAEFSTATGHCAAGCGQPVALGEAHYAVVLQAERYLTSNEIQPLDGDDLAYLHIGCWPERSITVYASPGAPGSAVVMGFGTGGQAPTFVERCDRAYGLIDNALQYELYGDWSGRPDGQQLSALHEAFEHISSAQAALLRAIHPAGDRS